MTAGTGGRRLLVVLLLFSAACAAPLLTRFLLAPAPVAVISAFGGLAGFAAVVVLLASALTRQLVAAVVAGLVVAGHAVVLAPLFSPEPSPDGARLRVLTANLSLGAFDAAGLVDLVREQRVEVLAVQELTVEGEQQLIESGLPDLLPHAVTDPGGGASGTGLWASRPLERLPGWDMTFRSSAAAMTVEGRRLVVRSVHPFPPRLTDQSRWRSDMAALRRGARAGGSDSTIVLGDLNGTLHHREVRRLLDAGGWRDAADAAGAGLLRTWSPRPWVPPLFDLDHVLVPRTFGVRRAAAIDLPGSDHEAVVAEVVVAFGPPRAD